MFSIPESIEVLLKVAAEKTGKSQEEILQLCLEHGIERMLMETDTSSCMRQMK